MLKICCNKCSRYNKPFLEFFDRLEVKEHILLCSLIQHGLLTFDDLGFQGSTDSCAQSWLPVVNKFSDTDPVRYVNILVMESDIEIRWIAADGRLLSSCTTQPYGAFLEIKYFLEALQD